MIRDWPSGGPIVLDRFPGYFRNEPENQHIIYKRVLENRLRRILFEINSIDSYEAPPAAYSRLENDEDFNLVKGPTILHTYVAWNLDQALSVICVCGRRWLKRSIAANSSANSLPATAPREPTLPSWGRFLPRPAPRN